MIRKRKYGRERHAAASTSTHIIKIGFNAGKVDEKTKKVERAFFGKLRGFVVFQNKTLANGLYPPDVPLMTRLIADAIRRDPHAAAVYRDALTRYRLPFNDADPVTPAATQAILDESFEHQLRMPDGLLPARLEFVLPCDATPGPEGDWTFPGTYDDAYVAYKVGGCPGEFCRGNGDTASRWQPDGTRRTIACNPMGKDGIEDAAQFCPFSIPTDSGKTGQNGKPIFNPPACKPIGWLNLVLAVRDEADRLVPLSKLADARFQFETSSERTHMAIQRALFDAARRLRGRIGGITGTLAFNIRNVAAPHHVGGTVQPTPQVDFILNEWDIARREAELRGTRILPAAAPAPLMIASDHEADAEGESFEPEFEPITDADPFVEGDVIDEIVPPAESQRVPARAAAQAIPGPVLDDTRGREAEAPRIFEPEPQREEPREPKMPDAQTLLNSQKAMAKELVEMARERVAMVEAQGGTSRIEAWIEFWTRKDGNKGVETVEVLFSQLGKDDKRHAAGMRMLKAAHDKAKAEIAALRAKAAAKSEQQEAASV